MNKNNWVHEWIRTTEYLKKQIKWHQVTLCVRAWSMVCNTYIKSHSKSINFLSRLETRGFTVFFFWVTFPVRFDMTPPTLVPFSGFIPMNLLQNKRVCLELVWRGKYYTRVGTHKCSIYKYCTSILVSKRKLNKHQHSDLLGWMMCF